MSEIELVPLISPVTLGSMYRMAFGWDAATATVRFEATDLTSAGSPVTSTVVIDTGQHPMARLPLTPRQGFYSRILFGSVASEGRVEAAFDNVLAF